MKYLPRWVKRLIVCVLSLQLTACGTIMHPERKGQVGGGRGLDIGVVLLDGIGLLFFIIPGVIAYAVDFSNGTIYLPGPEPSKNNAGRDRRPLKIVKFDPKHFTQDSLRRLIQAETSYDLDWHDPRLMMIKINNPDELPLYFAQSTRTAAESSLARSR